MIARVASAFPALAFPVFRRYLLAGTLLTIGGFMLQTAQGWLVLILTNSPALLGLAGAVTGLPTLFLAPVAGVLADRLDRRRVLIITNTTGALIGLTLAILTTTGIVEWDLRSKDNLEVAPGLYIFHVDAGDLGEHVGKFAIIK